ncbi:MAG: hypothetical protein R3C53_04085 [Pirellulaceae bacterium]
MDPTKAKSRGIDNDMSPASVERRLEMVDQLRELAVELGKAKRLGPIEKTEAASEAPGTYATDENR